MGELSERVLLWGADEPLPRQVPLRAGPLTLLAEDGSLRRIRLGDREVMRQLYVAVRDQSWGTVSGVTSEVQLDRHATSFRLRFSREHRGAGVDFRWTGTIIGDETGAITFTMDGVAGATFLRNRLGLNVLHPARECAGAAFTVERADGSLEQGRFPELISPHQPVTDVRGLAYEILPGVRARVRFEGDLFEMEDQRNWTDASFKTYSTPLRLPAPVRVEEGSRVTQAVSLTVEGAPASAGPPSLAISFVVGRAPAGLLPRIGLGMASHSEPLGDVAVRRLRALRLSHLRVDLVLSAPDHPGALGRAVAASRALGVPLEVALFLSGDADRELASLGALLAGLKPWVSAWLVFHVDERSTTERWVATARRPLRLYEPRARIGAGTNMFFAELNRGRPPLDAIDVAGYSINPQVHASDNTTLVENLVAQAWTVESARVFMGDRPLVVSPVTLRRRSRPGSTIPEPEATADGLPWQVDVRQLSLFGAAWTAGSLKYLAESGVASVTYYETTGWRGVMEREAGSPRPDRFPSRPGWVFPLYHVLADAGEWTGAQVVPSRSSDPLRLDGMVIRRDRVTRVVLANLTPEPIRATVAGLDRRVDVRTLDATTAERAMATPEAFRASGGLRRETSGGALDLDLRPYAVATLETAKDAPGV